MMLTTLRGAPLLLYLATEAAKWLRCTGSYVEPIREPRTAFERARWEQFATTPTTGLQVATLLEWLGCGFPTLEPSETLAASMMATSIGDVDALDLPWPCFAIRIPGRMLTIDGPLGPSIAEHAFVRTLPSGGINVSLEAHVTSDGGPFRLNTFHPASTIAGLLRDPEAFGERIDPYADDRVEALDYSEADHRSLRLLGRLVVGCLLELATLPSRPRPRAVKLSERIGGAGAPKLCAYQLTRPVRVDCRAMVAEYVKGGGKSPLVRSMVRGHWKRQPCGPRGELRKWLHVEPYWRGPEDAPIAVRPHVIRGDATAPPSGQQADTGRR